MKCKHDTDDDGNCAHCAKRGGCIAIGGPFEKQEAWYGRRHGRDNFFLLGVVTARKAREIMTEKGLVEIATLEGVGTLT